MLWSRREYMYIIWSCAPSEVWCQRADNSESDVLNYCHICETQTDVVIVFLMDIMFVSQIGVHLHSVATTLQMFPVFIFSVITKNSCLLVSVLSLQIRCQQLRFGVWAPRRSVSLFWLPLWLTCFQPIFKTKHSLCGKHAVVSNIKIWQPYI